MLLFFLFLWLCSIETQFRCFLVSYSLSSVKITLQTFLTILTVFSSTSIVFKKLEIAELLLVSYRNISHNQGKSSAI